MVIFCFFYVCSSINECMYVHASSWIGPLVYFPLLYVCAHMQRQVNTCSERWVWGCVGVCIEIVISACACENVFKNFFNMRQRKCRLKSVDSMYPGVLKFHVRECAPVVSILFRCLHDCVHSCSTSMVVCVHHIPVSCVYCLCVAPLLLVLVSYCSITSVWFGFCMFPFSASVLCF